MPVVEPPLHTDPSLPLGVTALSEGAVGRAQLLRARHAEIPIGDPLDDDGVDRQAVIAELRQPVEERVAVAAAADSDHEVAAGGERLAHGLGDARGDCRPALRRAQPGAGPLRARPGLTSEPACGPRAYRQS